MGVWQRAFELADLTALGAATLPGHVGIEFTARGNDSLTARMPVDARTHQPFGRLHGGASVVLSETVASVAATMALPEGKVAVGLEINANHIRPAMSGHVHATATAEAIGRTTQVWTVRIVDDAGKLVCLSRITLAVIEAG
ncbi:hotdog fold thioesterase [Sphingomonas donggukensis]|uniref:Hotdog fold thioesterase n=1 Tax=Sphingomonas donggukensis TaxID=2949093 RepID=A0ABY4TYB6_9SPHN|nr:hotdog fold thioesterase [Sphingomonas donggukensis]URW75298.1 hotdog fold thioesterase [Sphingomonas donggukensis]